MAKAGFFRNQRLEAGRCGQGGDARSYVIVMEEIARVSGVCRVFMFAFPELPSGGPFLLSGNAEQKEK
ncbi:MAG: acyl-CoA dehydrogenase family protein [Clostridium sp.]